ncbi:phage tail family protein [Pediococcus pentosaceus]|uniref:phage tail domain-containing protein n=1 Tax=Pediococcus pentosaceus TaxID=1255 RepID=UPI0026586182|nr:phage tail domain-containing protein [Pediococcus pentosaceus]WKF70456.1 phage tail family protein [Pediococcus pentosaceus]
MQVFSGADRHPYRFNEVDNHLFFNPIEIAISYDGINWKSTYNEHGISEVNCYDVDVGASVEATTLRKFAGSNGQVVDSSSYDPRTITAHVYAPTFDYIDADLIFKELDRFFSSNDGYWIAFSNSPGKKYWVMPMTITRTTNSDGGITVDIPFNNITGVAQSISSAPEMFGEKPQNVAYDSGVRMDMEKPQYTFTKSEFDVFNAGSIAIDPLRNLYPLTITAHFSGKLTIANQTNGSSFSYNGNAKNTDTFTIRQISPYLNGALCGKDTDNGIIQISPGINHFKVSGGKLKDISFDFAFIYPS